MVLSCQNVGKAFHEKQVFKNCSFHIEDHEKAAIVGINGAGKTTLLRILTGELDADEGMVVWGKDVSFGYLPQNAQVEGSRSIYDEVLEGMAGTIKNKIKITGEDSVEIMKSGLSSSHMIFEKNKKNLTYYRTPYGQMLVGINTRKMEISVEEDKIDVLVDYELDVNHEPLADCKIKMNIMSKENKKFSVLS